MTRDECRAVKASRLVRWSDEALYVVQDLGAIIDQASGKPGSDKLLPYLRLIHAKAKALSDDLFTLTDKEIHHR